MTRCTTPSSRRRTTFSQDGDYLYRDVKYTCGALGSHDPRCPTGRQNLQLAVDLTSAALPDARAVGEGVRVVGGRVLSRVAPKAAEAVESAADAARGLCSFTAATPVLMADGTTKPISQIHQGDRVLATDPHTGKHYARTVTRVWIHTDTFIHLNIDCQSLTVTEDHPIWDATDHTWERADQVHIGDLVTIADGRAAHVTGLDVRRTPAAPACNLTVDQTHTYHVGALAVLVHNTCGAGESVPPEVNWNQQEKRFAGNPNHIPGRSELTADPRRLAAHLGSGQPLNSIARGMPGFRERIAFDEEIGTYVDPVTGTRSTTSRAIVHYGQRGVHFVPSRP